MNDISILNKWTYHGLVLLIFMVAMVTMATEVMVTKKPLILYQS